MHRVHRHAVSGLVVVLGLAVLGCDRNARSGGSAGPEGPETLIAPQDREAAEASTPSAGDAAFHLAQPEIIDSDIPARFSAEIPATVEEFRGDWSERPPPSWITWSLCAGDAEMHRRMIRAIERAGSHGSLDPALANAYVSLYDYCSTQAKCEALVDGLTRHKGTAVQQVLWAAFAKCDKLEYQAFVDREAISDQVVLDWYFGLSGEQPASERAMRAAEAVALTRERNEVRKAGIVLGRFRDARGVEAVKRIRAQLADPVLEAVVSVGLKYVDTSEAQALYQQACAHTSQRSEALCSTYEPELPSSIADGGPYTNIDHLIRRYDFDAREFLAKNPARRAEVLAAYARCAREQPHATQYRGGRAFCLEKMVAVERAAAVSAMRAPGRAPSEDWEFISLANALARYPKPGALEQALREWGLIGERPVNTDGHRPPIRAREVLWVYGRLTNFDVETGQFPNEHDSLLRDLAAMTSPGLDGAVFEELPPSRTSPLYWLRAYMDGKRYEWPARDYGDWYDVGQVIGALNTLLQVRGSDIRFAVLPTGDQTANVAVGPAAGLLAARRAGLIQFGDDDDAREAGRAAEDALIDKLREGGVSVDRDVRIDTQP